MCCFLAALGTAHIDGAGLELDRRLLQAMTETDQDHSRVAVAVAVTLGRLDQALDLTLGQVLPIATHFAIDYRCALACLPYRAPALPACRGGRISSIAFLTFAQYAT